MRSRMGIIAGMFAVVGVLSACAATTDDTSDAVEREVREDSAQLCARILPSGDIVYFVCRTTK
jgi:protein involved in sex pheromone biosynthesis